MDSEGRLTERDLSGLRVILNAWDPIGIIGGNTEGVEDEYDCLRWPLVSRFERGASRREVAKFLRIELRDHFGIDGSVTDEALGQMFAWWKSTGVS